MVVVTFRSVVVAMVVLFASNNQQPTVILSIYEYPTIDNPYLVVEYIRGTSTSLRLCLTYDEGGGKVDCYFFGVYSYRTILYEQHVYGIWRWVSQAYPLRLHIVFSKDPTSRQQRTRKG